MLYVNIDDTWIAGRGMTEVAFVILEATTSGYIFET